MIPQKIHYCWFGRNPLPEKAKKCIASWKKFCPDYEIIQWNEDNFNIDLNGYTRWCYDNKKYAFLSDYVRLLVVYDQGGIYFDTDVELIRPIGSLLQHDAFFGFETPAHVASGLGFGSVARGIVITAMLREYDLLLDGTKGVIGCPILNTQALIRLGLQPDGTMQRVADAVIYPSEYFNPYESSTGLLHKTKNTYSIHWYSASWISPAKRLRCAIGRPLHRIFGVNFFRRFHK